MGNENQMKNLPESISIFLPETIADPDGKPKLYSLNEEFAKTKKNKNPFFYLAVGSFVAALIFVAVLVTVYVQRKSLSTEISISEFEDIKLMEILDTVKKYENDLNVAKRELADLQGQMNDELAYAPDEASRQRILARRQAGIAAKQAKINDLQGKIDQYDQRLQENMKKAESVVQNYQKMHRIQMEEQQAYYEKKIDETVLRYNPYFQSGRILGILNIPIPAPKAGPRLNDYLRELRDENIISEKDFKSLQGMVNDNSALVAQMLDVPYKNSVAPTLQHVDYFQKAIAESYEKIWTSLVRAVREKNQALAHFRYAFDYSARMDSEAGYVIDPRDAKSIIVYLSGNQNVKEGDIGMVFRTDDNYIGKIQFFQTVAGMRAKIVDMQDNRAIRPLDKILIKLKQE